MDQKAIIHSIQNSIQTIYGKEEANAIARQLYEYLSRKNLLNESQLQKSIDLLLLHTPLQYITGEAWFYHRCFQVNPSVLIPRPETEELVELIFKTLKENQPSSIIDIGTGSGCIAITLKHLFPQALVRAIDKSTKAIELAKKNGNESGATILFEDRDFLADHMFELKQKFDLIVSNPPYIPENEHAEMKENVKNHEPEMALFVPANHPLVFYEQIAKFGKTNLTDRGMIFAEIHYKNGKSTKKLFEDYGYKVSLHKDMSNNDRFIVATF